MKDAEREEAITRRVAALLDAEFGVTRKNLNPATRFREDLGLDSLALVRLQVAVEDEWKIRLDPMQAGFLKALSSVGGLVALIQEMRRG